MKRYFPRTMMLSAALSLASLGGTVGQCAMAGPDRDPVYKKSEESARFCYQTLGDISCYAAPQANMGPIVALEPEKIPTDEEIEAAEAKANVAPAPGQAVTIVEPEPAEPVKAKVTTTSTTTTKTTVKEAAKVTAGVPASMAPDYPKPRVMPTPSAPIPLTKSKTKN